MPTTHTYSPPMLQSPAECLRAFPYGALGVADNCAGKVMFRKDASGWQTFKYGKLGETIENIRTFAVPFDAQIYTFRMNFEYDSWNRIQSMTYPDGEVVHYGYNPGGMLKSVSGTKMNHSYPYIDSIRYNEFELKEDVWYGNGAQCKYGYNILQRLSGLQSYTASNELMQNISYTYDEVGNITDIDNSAGILSNGLGGPYSNIYQYDNLYRLVYSEGSWLGNPNTGYELEMTYHPNGRISRKTLTAAIVIQTPMTNSFNPVEYDNMYHYTNSSQPNTLTYIDNGPQQEFVWDAKGNLIYHRHEGLPMKRHLCWDEQNRLQGVMDDNSLSVYQYDANGDRTYKLTGKHTHQNISGTWHHFYQLDNATLYASSYLVVTPKGYTKHYYAESERVASKLGKGGLQELDHLVVEEHLVSDKYFANTDHAQNVVYECLHAEETRPSAPLSYLYELIGTSNEPEDERYWYHPDHLGSSSWITYSNGEAIQHLHYLPYGEDLVNQRTTDYAARFTFSAKEKDSETGFSYFGSRYYNSDLSIWLSVDPMSDKYPSLSPYTYCANNPIKLVDPNGEEIDWVEKADGTIYWDDNATSQETTKEGEKYLGKNVLVANHGRDADLNEAVNGATFDLYLESDHTGPTASIVGNTVPCDVDAYGTLPEGLYDTKYNGLYNGEPSLRILQKSGESYYNPKRPAGDLPTVKGNPNNPVNKGKDKSEHIMNGILFHLGNYGRESLTTSTGRPITEGCQTGKHGAGSKTEYQKFASNFVGKNGIIYYLRATPK